ncbi:MAG: hypothetical protein K2X28_00340 [Alphaproteobacteria bacterium]|nr:hypothetical protein [Alphaproteobacteria bacterium]
MPVLDENGLLSEAEKQTYSEILTAYGHDPHHFLLEIVEDQEAMDMNDLSYVIIVKTTATHLELHKSKSYRSQANTGTWLVEFEKDLKNGVFQAD